MVANDPYFANQWHYQGPAVSAGGANLPGAWDITTGAAGITVAIIDTGLRPHPDIGTNILGGGRLVPGYDFINDVAIGNDGDGRDVDPTDPGDWVEAEECGPESGAEGSSWHGTHVAGTIGALSNNGTGITGVNWVSKLLTARVLGKCGGYNSDIADAMRWSAGLAVTGIPANQNPARVLNLSLGGAGACSRTMQNTINAVVAVNAVVVAAGNEDSDVSTSSPANCDNVISVAAVGPTGGRAYYSNYGSLISIAAPGGEMRSANDSDGILSALDSGTTSPGAPTYKYCQGTSMAAPHVAGIVSLMLSANPALTPAQVLFTLQTTARAFPLGLARTCSTSMCGAGIIDATAAVTAVRPSSAGTLQLSAASAKVNEAAAVAALLVSRSDGSSGSVSVNYASTGGTARSGVDFSAVIGTLTWADGDTSAKAISIPIANDGMAEGPEAFTVNLSSPAGGAILGSVNGTAVTIVDPDIFLSNGSLPDGWVVSAGADAGWSVAVDRSYSGTYSLKSDAIGHGRKAQLEISKSFSAGNVSFARRVSSESGADHLRFYIDGVKQQEWSGEQGWAMVSYPLAVGNHTLRWSYEKDSSDSQGSDAAWIDDVSIPAEYVPCTYQISSAAQSLGARGVNGGVDVTAPSHCPWTAASNAGWLSVTSGASGAGNGKVRYSVAANPATPAREGTLTIAGNTFTVSQTNSGINTVRNAFFVNPSTSTNKTSVVRLINLNSQGGAITATAYNEAGAVVGSPDFILGSAAAQQMLTFSSAQLEAAIGYVPTSGTAKYRIEFGANLPSYEVINFIKDVATGNLTLAQAQAGNRGAVSAQISRRHALFVNPSTSANKSTVIRIINNSALAGTVKATAYNEAGNIVGLTNANLGAISPQQMLSFSSAQLEAAIGYTPSSGSAKYHVAFSANLPDFELINFIKDVKTGNLALGQAQIDNRAASTAASSSRHALFVNPSSSTSKTSVLRLINLGSKSGSVTATAYDEAGNIVGADGAPVGALGTQQMLTLTSAQLESALGYTPSSPTAKYRIVFNANLSSFEVINFIKDVATGNLNLGQNQVD